MSKGVSIMKSKINIKIVVGAVSLVMVMLISGCSNLSTDNQQPTAANSKSNPAASDESMDKADLSGNVAKIDESKITIVKTTKDKKDNVAKSPKRGSALAAKSMVSFEVSNDTKVIVRTVENAFSNGNKYTDAAGSISDIKVNSMVNVWGKKEGYTIKAAKVLVYIFLK